MEIDINKIISDVRAASEALDTALHDALDAHALHAALDARDARHVMNIKESRGEFRSGCTGCCSDGEEVRVFEV